MKITHYSTYQVDPADYGHLQDSVEIFDSCKFYSNGKNGSFELRILITRLKNDTDENSFNLGFGVWDALVQDIDDLLETKNDDTQTILVTVAQRALEFLKRYPQAELYAVGSTRARTRLYQREILKIIDQVPASLRIEGLIRDKQVGFVDFQKGINFDAFLLSSK